MGFSSMTQEEREIYQIRDGEIRESIAAYIVGHIDELVTVAEQEGISSLKLAAHWQELYHNIVGENDQRDYTEQLRKALNAQSAGLVDKFAGLFEDNYMHEPDLSAIKEKGRLPKDDEYYPSGIEIDQRAA